jgi:RHS repeat-associated protein
MAYAGRGQSERVSYKTTSFTDTVLGTTIEQTGTTARNYVRDEKNKFVAERVNTNGQIARRYPLFDQLGSTVALTDEQGGVVGRYVYEDPFGNNPVASGNASTALRFAGGYYDPDIALYKFGERYYMPSLGRWTQRDPLNQAFSPREANRYLYAGQDPVNLTDPTGMIFGYGWDDLGYTLVGAHTFVESTVLASASVAGGLACSAATGGWGTAACVGVAAGGVATAGAGYYLSIKEFGMIGTNP